MIWAKLKIGKMLIFQTPNILLFLQPPIPQSLAKGHCPLIPVNVRLILLSQQIIKMQGFSQKYLKKLSKLKIQVKVNNYRNISKATSWN